MTNPEQLPPDVPEADLADQQVPVHHDEDGLDPARLENADDIEANLADLIDQAISVPLPSDDYDDGR